MRTAILLVATLLPGCGDSDARDSTPAAKLELPPPPPPIPEGMVRVQAVDPIPELDAFDGDWWKEGRWAFDWLESEGWAFFAWQLESGSAGTASLRWSDPRVSGRDLGTISCELSAGKRVLLVYGVRHENRLFGRVRLQCQGCGSRFEMSGSITSGDSTGCPKCGEKVLFDEARSQAPGRECRVFVFGNARKVSGSRNLASRGSVWRSGREPAFTLFRVEVPRQSMMDPTANACDPLRIQGRGSADYGSGAHLISRRYAVDPASGGGGNSRSVRSRDGRIRFEVLAGDASFRGDDTGYVVVVNGEPVDAADYPRAVWEVELTWKPE